MPSVVGYRWYVLRQQTEFFGNLDGRHEPPTQGAARRRTARCEPLGSRRRRRRLSMAAPHEPRRPTAPEAEPALDQRDETQVSGSGASRRRHQTADAQCCAKADRDLPNRDGNEQRRARNQTDGTDDLEGPLPMQERQ